MRGGGGARNYWGKAQAALCGIPPSSVEASSCDSMETDWLVYHTVCVDSVGEVVLCFCLCVLLF